MAKSQPKRSRRKYRKVEYDGTTYRLAVLKKGIDIPLEEKMEIVRVICLIYETDDYSLDECCKKVGISVRTLFKWRGVHSEISELYLEAEKSKEEIYRYTLQKRGRTTVERLLDGYTVELTEREFEPGTDSEGNPIMRTVKVKKKEMFVRPSPSIVQMAVFNTDPRMFEKSPKPVDKINKDVDIAPIEWVKDDTSSKDK